MSTVSSLGSTSTLNNAATSTSTAQSMSSSDFMKVMITQLENQDPVNPTDSNQLLTQLSQISQLQSNTDMQSNISALTLQQSIGAAGNLIGKQVKGIATTGESVTGSVAGVQVQDHTVYLQLDSGKELPMQNVTTIAAQTTAAAGTTPTGAPSSPTAAQLLQYLSGLMGSGGSTGS